MNLKNKNILLAAIKASSRAKKHAKTHTKTLAVSRPLKTSLLKVAAVALLLGGAVYISTQPAEAGFWHGLKHLTHSVSHTLKKAKNTVKRGIKKATRTVHKAVKKTGDVANKALHEAAHKAAVAKDAAKDALHKTATAVTQAEHDAAHTAVKLANKTANEAHKAIIRAGQATLNATQTAKNGVKALGNAAIQTTHQAINIAHNATQQLGHEALKTTNVALHGMQHVGEDALHAGEVAGRAVGHAGEVAGKAIGHAGEVVGKGVATAAKATYNELSHPGKLLKDLVTVKMEINKAIDKAGPLRKILTNPVLDALVVGMVPGAALMMPAMQLMLMPMPGGGQQQVPMQPDAELVHMMQEPAAQLLSINLCNPWNLKNSWEYLDVVEKAANHSAFAKATEDKMFKMTSTGEGIDQLIEDATRGSGEDPATGAPHMHGTPESLLILMMIQNGAKPDAKAAVARFKGQCRAKIMAAVKQAKAAQAASHGATHA